MEQLDEHETAKTGINIWVFREDGCTVLVRTSDPLPRQLWMRLKNYVDVIMPPEDPRSPDVEEEA